MSTKSKVLDYIENVLEVPRQEYNGMPACPFAKQERKSNNIYIDEVASNLNKQYPSDSDFVMCMSRFVKSGMNSAVFIQKDFIEESDTVEYQKYLNRLLKTLNITYWKALCINPNDKLEADGFNARSLAPCFLILINPKKQINEAHKSMLGTKYYDKMSDKYKKYLNVK